ncbi:MAG: hypothetical protein AAGD22_08360 [Verrucomicrobiota bacterium]
MMTLSHSVSEPIEDSALTLLDELLADRRLGLSSKVLDRLLEFRARVAENEDAAEVMRAYFRLAGVLSAGSYLSYYRVRREVDRRMRAVVFAPEWTDRTMRFPMRLEQVNHLSVLESRMRRDFFEEADDVIPLGAILVRFEFI